MYTCANLTASCEEHPKWKNTAFQSFLWQGQVLFFFLLANFKPTSSHFLLKAASEGHTKTEYSSENYCHQIWWTKFNNNNMVKCFGFPFFGSANHFWYLIILTWQPSHVAMLVHYWVSLMVVSVVCIWKNEKANMYIMAPVNISMKYVQIKLKTKIFLIQTILKIQKNGPDQTWSNFIKIDQNWSNLIKNMIFDQFWSILIKFDQVWSIFIKFHHFLFSLKNKEFGKMRKYFFFNLVEYCWIKSVGSSYQW